MKSGNTMNKISYIFWNLFWTAIAAILCQKVLPRGVHGVSDGQSKFVLLFIFGVALLVNLTINFEDRRNGDNILHSVLLSYVTYITFTLPQSMRFGFIVKYISFWVALVIIYNMFLFAAKKEKSRLLCAIKGVCNLASICVILLMFVAGTEIIIKEDIAQEFGDNAFLDTRSAGYHLAQLDAYTIKDNIEVLCQLKEDVWATLDTHEKLDVLQMVANIERTYLGLPHELYVKSKLLGETTCGSYNDATNTIFINENYLYSEPATELLDTLCHEARHAYQHRLVDALNQIDGSAQNLLTFREVSEYENNFNNYVKASEDPKTYYLQECEIDSRTYAQNAVEDYYNRIEEHLESA